MTWLKDHHPTNIKPKECLHLPVPFDVHFYKIGKYWNMRYICTKCNRIIQRVVHNA